MNVPIQWLPALKPLASRASTMKILAVLMMAAATAAIVACGSSGGGSGGSSSTSAQGTTSIQVLATAQRGDITQTTFGIAKLATLKGKTKAIATIPAQNAASVAIGQSATVMVFRFQNGGQGIPSNMPAPQGGQGMPSGAPAPQGGQGMPSGAPVPEGGQGAPPFAQGGQGGFGQGRFRDGTPGTVTAVKTNADGSVTATITLSKQPTDASATSRAFASIQMKVLAKDVVVIPTAAIKTDGGTSTVQVLSGGKTTTRTVTVGQQSGGESEVVSGLSVGENVVYKRTFTRPNGRSPFPGQGQGQFSPGGQSNGSSL